MSNSGDVVISVKNVSKHFKLPHEKHNSLKGAILNTLGRKKVDKGYEIQHALKDVSFEVPKGEFFGILGRNGSGKSTLLKMLAGIYQPTTGKIETKGKLVPFIELGVGFNPELSGRENVYLNGALLGFTRREIDAMYEDIVEFAELRDFMDQKLKNYSSGMQVRLAFSVATRAQAEVLIVDEVLAVGDMDFQRKCYDYFKQLKNTDVTVVFVTHDMSAVREYCDRAILIEKGEIQAQGSAEVVADEYLQLFNGTEAYVDESEQERWGTGEVRVTDIVLESTKEDISFELTIQSRKKFEKIVVAYNFRKADGTAVMGGNSMNVVERRGEMDIAKDEIKSVSFVTPNFLGSGEYTLEVAVKLANGTILDKRSNAGKIKVAKIESYYPTIGLAKMTVKTIKE